MGTQRPTWHDEVQARGWCAHLYTFCLAWNHGCRSKPVQLITNWCVAAADRFRSVKSHRHCGC